MDLLENSLACFDDRAKMITMLISSVFGYVIKPLIAGVLVFDKGIISKEYVGLLLVEVLPNLHQQLQTEHAFEPVDVDSLVSFAVFQFYMISLFILGAE